MSKPDDLARVLKRMHPDKNLSIAVNVAPGSGMWKTMTGLGKMQRRYFDAVSGQAGYYGLVDEGSAVSLVTVRLRVQDRKLTEAEWYIARENDPGLQGPRQPGRPPPRPGCGTLNSRRPWSGSARSERRSSGRSRSSGTCPRRGCAPR